eukprot:gene1106-1246_t
MERQNWQSASAKELSDLKLQSLEAQEVLRQKGEDALAAARLEADQAVTLARSRGDELERRLHELQSARSAAARREQALSQSHATATAGWPDSPPSSPAKGTAREAEKERAVREEDEAVDESRGRDVEAGLRLSVVTLVRVTAQLKDAEQAALSSASRIAQLQSTTSAQQEQLRGAAAEIERGNQDTGPSIGVQSTIRLNGGLGLGCLLPPPTLTFALALLQEQNHRLREKVQLKSEVIRRQEALVMEMKQRVADLEQRLAAGVQ